MGGCWGREGGEEVGVEGLVEARRISTKIRRPFFSPSIFPSCERSDDCFHQDAFVS